MSCQLCSQLRLTCIIQKIEHCVDSPKISVDQIDQSTDILGRGGAAVAFWVVLLLLFLEEDAETNWWCVCVCVCVHVCVGERESTCIVVCSSVCAYAWVRVCACLHVCVHVCTGVCACAQERVRARE